MRRVINRIRQTPHYRREAFEAGILKAGLQPATDFSGGMKKDDILLIWNKYGQNQLDADRLQTIGGTVIVVENGYLGKDKNNIQYYAMAVNEHNGAGIIPSRKYDRWRELNIELKPWRKSGDHIVVRSQRGIGSRMMANPRDWTNNVVKRLKKVTKRPIIVRPHPRDDKEKNLERDLRNAHALVVWGSSEAGRALVRGIPVFYEAPRHVLEGCMIKGIDDLENPWMGERYPSFQRLAWSQWSVEEISTGVPIKLLLERV